MTTQAIANYLETGFWTQATSNPLDFGVSEPHNWSNKKNFISYDVTDLNTNTQDLVHTAFDRWDDLIDEDFKSVKGVADIDFTTGGGNFTQVNYPGNNPVTLGNNGILQSATVTLNNVNSSATDTSPVFTTILHEIGHALGLGHAGPYNAGGDELPDGGSFSDAIFSDDSDQKTVMSYFRQDQNPNVTADRASPITPQIADFLAVKSIYGLESDTRDLDTTYGYGAHQDAAFSDPAAWNGNNASFTIYDAGGTDTISMHGADTDQTIDLRPGQFSSVGGGADVNNGGDTLQGNMAIAQGVEIENATGGTGNDDLTGNDLDNRLFGRGGDDTMAGRGGDDTFAYGEVSRTTLKNDTDAADTIDGGPGQDRVLFRASDTTFDLADTTIRSVEEIDLAPGYHDMTLALESDQFRGAGTDLGQVLIDNAKNLNIEIAMTGANLDLSGLTFDDPTPRSPSLVAEHLVTVNGDATAETIATTPYADKIVAGDGSDTVRAKGGDDRVESNGNDDLWGGAGFDTVDFSGASFSAASIDLSAGNVYHDGWLRWVGTPGRDNPQIQTLDSFERVEGASGGNTIRGDNDGNRLDGNGGADELHPKGGVDELTGGRGPDTFVLEPKIGPNNEITDFQDDRDELDLAAFGFDDFSDVANRVTDTKAGIELTLNSRTEEHEVFVEDPFPHVEKRTFVEKDKVELVGMDRSDFDADDVDLTPDQTTWSVSGSTDWLDFADALSLQPDGGLSESALAEVFRFYNTKAGGHFYTASEAEAQKVRNKLDAFRDEGVGFTALEPDASDVHPEATDVFRFYNTAAGGHFYTASESEAQTVRDELDAFRDEGVGFRAFESQVDGTVPVYRFYNTEAGGHFYTADAQEAAHVRNNLEPFKAEGVEFYAYPEDFDLETLGLSETDVDGLA